MEYGMKLMILLVIKEPEIIMIVLMDYFIKENNILKKFNLKNNFLF